MSLPKFAYLSPKTIQEACSLLLQYGDKARVMAGGTDLLVKMKVGEATPQYLIGLSNIANLDYIEIDGEGLRIGALATLSSVAGSSVIQERFGALAKIAAEMGTPQVRNMGTVAGNLCNALPSADTASILISRGAKLKLVNPQGERIIPLEEFFIASGETILQDGEILAEIQVPSKPPHTGEVYLRITRTAVDYATVGVATLVTLGSKNGTCSEAKIVLGAVAPTPIRARKAEGAIKGKEIEEGLIEEAARLASEEARPRTRPEYKRKLVRVLTRRALRQALEQAKSA